MLSSCLIARLLGIVFQVINIFSLEFWRHFVTVSCLPVSLLRNLILFLFLSPYPPIPLRVLRFSLYPLYSEVSPWCGSFFSFSVHGAFLAFWLGKLKFFKFGFYLYYIVNYLYYIVFGTVVHLFNSAFWKDFLDFIF